MQTDSRYCSCRKSIKSFVGMMKWKFQIRMTSRGGGGCIHKDTRGQGVRASAISAVPYFLTRVVDAWLLIVLLFMPFLCVSNIA